MATRYVHVPRNAALIATIEARLPGGDTLVIQRYESHTRGVPTQWVTHLRFDTAGRRTMRLAEQFTGQRIARIDHEWAESINLIRRGGAAEVTVKDRDDITGQDTAKRRET